MTSELIEVEYYYIRRASVKVEYIDKNTEEVIKQDDLDTTIIIDGYEGDEYITEEKVFKGYELEKDSEGNPILPENKDGEMKVVQNDDGTINNQTIVRYYYRKVSKVIEQHINIITGEDIIEPIIHNGYVGEEYGTEEREFEWFETVWMGKYYEKLVSENADLLKDNGVETLEKLLEKLEIEANEKYIPKNASGEFSDETEVVTYYYIRKITVKVTYIDRNTDKILPDIVVNNDIKEEKDSSITIDGYEGDYYETKEKTFEGYEIVQENYPTNNKGKMKPVKKDDGTIENTIYVTYYYARKSSGVKVEYVDVSNGDHINETTNVPGKEGDSYETKPKDIDGYDLYEEKLPNNDKGEMTTEETVVRYYYIKKAKVIIKYVDENTNQEITTETVINGHEGDKYATAHKNVDGYKIKRGTDNVNGEMSREDIVVTYYYEKLPVQNPTAPQQPSKPQEPEKPAQPVQTIKPTEEKKEETPKVEKTENETIKTGGTPPQVYVGIIAVVIGANMIQMMFFRKKKTKFIK